MTTSAAPEDTLSTSAGSPSAGPDRPPASGADEGAGPERVPSYDQVVDRLEAALSPAADPEATRRAADDLQRWLDRGGEAAPGVLDLLGHEGPAPIPSALRAALLAEGDPSPERLLVALDACGRALLDERMARLRLTLQLRREHADNVNRAVLYQRRLDVLAARLRRLDPSAPCPAPGGPVGDDLVLIPVDAERAPVADDPDPAGDALREALLAARLDARRLEDGVESLKSEADLTRHELEAARVERDEARREIDLLIQDLDAAHRKVAEIATLHGREEGLHRAALAERDALLAEREALTAERDALITHTHALGARVSALQAAADRLEQIRSSPPLALLRRVRALLPVARRDHR